MSHLAHWVGICRPDIDRSRNELAVAGPEGFDLATPGTSNILGRQSDLAVDAFRHFVDCCLDGKPPLVRATVGVAPTRILCVNAQSCEREGGLISLDRD